MNGETCITLGGGVALAAMFSSNLMHQATICALPQIASRLGHPEFRLRPSVVAVIERRSIRKNNGTKRIHVATIEQFLCRSAAPERVTPL